MKPAEILEQIKKSLEEDGGKNWKGWIDGAYGDQPGQEGIIEWVKNVGTVQDKKILVKFWGCDFLYKGIPRADFLASIFSAKSLVSIIPREIVLKSTMLKFALGFLYLFSRKNFWHYVKIYVGVIHEGAVKNNLTVTEIAGEIKRMGVLFGYNNVHIHLLNEYINNRRDKSISKRERYDVFVMLMDFLSAIIENDTAYRVRFQDVVFELDQSFTDIRKEINRLFELAKAREHQILDKLAALQKILNYVLYDEDCRKFLESFLRSIDKQKVIMDESDWYFALGREGYDFRGINFKERMEERKRIDIEHKHVYVRVKLNDQGQISSFEAREIK